MAARRSKPQAKRSGGMKYGITLLIGLLLGLGAALAWYLYGDRGKLDALLPTPNPQAQAAPTRAEREPVAQETAPAAEAKPQYDFYTVLPEKEVALPEAEAAAAAANAATPPADAAATSAATNATPAAAGGQLQAGAFSTAGDAEALKAQIAMAGQTARVETVTVDGRTLHRVRLGPFASDAEREAAQRALAEAGVNATAVR